MSTLAITSWSKSNRFIVEIEIMFRLSAIFRLRRLFEGGALFSNH